MYPGVFIQGINSAAALLPRVHSGKAFFIWEGVQSNIQLCGGCGRERIRYSHIIPGEKDKTEFPFGLE